MRVHSRTSYSKATPSGSFFANQASAASLLAKTLRGCPVVLRERIPVLSQRTRTESPQIKTTQNCKET
jgi:hypothetical protein